MPDSEKLFYLRALGELLLEKGAHVLKQQVQAVCLAPQIQKAKPIRHGHFCALLYVRGVVGNAGYNLLKKAARPDKNNPQLQRV